MTFAITRQEILDAARGMLGYRFCHQARGEDNRVDCVGLLVVLGRRLGYPDIRDVTGYKRVPSASVIRETLSMNCDEVPLAAARPGDVYLMRMGGIKPRHTSIFYSDETDAPKGIRPMILHATAAGVSVEPVSRYPSPWYVAAFRLRGVTD